MGNSENREMQVQSQPNLPSVLIRDIELKDYGSIKANLTKRELVDSLMEKMRKVEEEKK